MTRELVVVDTNVAGFVYRGTPELVAYEGDLKAKRLALPFQTVAEMWFGARLANWGRAKLNSLDGFIRALVVIPHDGRLEEAWVDVMARARLAGLELDAADGWIAAAAIARRAPLVTHDSDLASLATIAVPGLRVVSRL